MLRTLIISVKVSSAVIFGNVISDEDDDVPSEETFYQQPANNKIKSRKEHEELKKIAEKIGYCRKSAMQDQSRILVMTILLLLDYAQGKVEKEVFISDGGSCRRRSRVMVASRSRRSWITMRRRMRVAEPAVSRPAM